MAFPRFVCSPGSEVGKFLAKAAGVIRLIDQMKIGQEIRRVATVNTGAK
jgi:hypothetical protein